MASGRSVGPAVRPASQRPGLGQQHEWLATAADVSEDGIVVVDPSGSVLMWSPGAERLYGYSAVEMLGRNAAEVLAPRRDGSEPRAAVSRPETGGASSADVDCVRKDGTPITVWVKRSPIVDDQGRLVAVVGVSREVTERHRLEERLVASEERYRALVESATDVITRVSGETIRLTYVSPSVRHVFGWYPDELVGRLVTDILHEEDMKAPATLRVLDDGDELRLRTMRVARRDGSWAWCEVLSRSVIDPNSGVEEVQSSVRDVSERIEAEQRLRESEERFRLSFENAPIGKALVSLDSRFLSVNEALCGIVGYSAEDLLAKTLQDITHPDDLAGDVTLAARLAEGEIPPYQMDKRYLHADGRTVWVQLNASVVRAPDEAPLYFVAQIQDITDRRSQSLALAAANEELKALSHVDPMTGLANRRRFEEELARVQARHRASGGHYAVIMADLDNLKQINDEHGHGAGDEAICVVASCLRGCTRSGDLVARFGGDEFVVLLPSSDSDAAARAMERIERELAGLRSSAAGVAVSVGMASSERGEDPLAAADAHMYSAKRNRKSPPAPYRR